MASSLSPSMMVTCILLLCFKSLLVVVSGSARTFHKPWNYWWLLNNSKPSNRRCYYGKWKLWPSHWDLELPISLRFDWYFRCSLTWKILHWSRSKIQSIYFSVLSLPVLKPFKNSEGSGRMLATCMAKRCSPRVSSVDAAVLCQSILWDSYAVVVCYCDWNLTIKSLGLIHECVWCSWNRLCWRQQSEASAWKGSSGEGKIPGIIQPSLLPGWDQTAAARLGEKKKLVLWLNRSHTLCLSIRLLKIGIY